MSFGFKTTVQLYRDCLRLIKYVAGDSAKGRQMRLMVGGEFRRHKDETDPEKIEELRFNAIRGLSNYLLFEAASKDDQMRARMRKMREEYIEEKTEGDVTKPPPSSQ